MSNPLMLKIVVDDKGNPVLKDMQSNIGALDKRSKSLGATMTKVFASTVMIAAMYKFQQAIGAATNEVFGFNKVFKQIEGITGTSGKALDALKLKTLALSNATEYSAVTLGKTALSISKMGFNLEQSLAVLPQVADLATASIGELDDVAHIAVQTMKSFNMVAEDMPYIVNVIHGAVSQTAIDFEDFMQSLKFVAPVANTMNISLAETAAMVGILGDIGIKGSLGGTSLRNMFLNILKPSEKVRDVLMGLNTEGLTFTKILEALHQNKIPINEFLATFNKRAVTAALGLSQVTERIRDLTKELDENKFKVKDAADIIRMAWVPQLKMLENSFVNVFVVMGDILDESDLGLGIKGITEKFIELQNWMRENPEVVVQFARDIATITEKLAKLAADGFVWAVKHGNDLIDLLKLLASLQLILWLDKVTSRLIKMGIGFAKAAAGLKTFGSLSKVSLGPLGVAVTIGWSLKTVLEAIADKWADIALNASRAAASMEKVDLQNKLRAVENFIWVVGTLNKAKKEIGDIKETGDPWGADYKRLQQLEKIMSDQDKYINKEIKTLAKTYGLPELFFETMRNNPELIKNGILLQLKEADKVAELRKEVNKSFGTAPLTIPLGDPKVAADKGKLDMFAYFDAALDVQRQIGGLLNLGINPGISFAPQLKGISQTVDTFPREVTELPKYQGLSPLDGLGTGIAERVQPDLMTARYDFILNSEKELATLREKYSDLRVTKERESVEELQIMWSDYAIWDAQRLQEANDFYWGMAHEYINTGLQTIDILDQFQDIAFEKMRSRHQEQLRMLDERSSREIKNAEGNAYKQRIIEARYLKEKQKLQDEQMKREKEYKEKQRVWSMIESAINTSVGVTAAYRMGAAGIPLGIIIGLLGAAQIGLIASQDAYESGGYTGNGNPKDVAGLVHRKEFVVDAPTTDALGGESGVQRMINERLNASNVHAKTVYVTIGTLVGNEAYKRQLFIEIEKESRRW